MTQKDVCFHHCQTGSHKTMWFHSEVTGLQLKLKMFNSIEEIIQYPGQPLSNTTTGPLGVSDSTYSIRTEEGRRNVFNFT